MTAFEQLWVWQDPAAAKRLGWYRDVAANKRTAKFRIAAMVPVGVSLDEAPEAALWDELDRLTPAFLERLRGVREGGETARPPASGSALTDLCRTLARRMLAHCNFCAWNCRVDRTRGTKVGTCRLALETRVSSTFHHGGEELVYRGTRGSGTIFFTSCNMRCAFCQNGDISTDKDNGMTVDARTLATMAWLLRMEGCHNINWVGGEATIHLHTIVEAIALLAQSFVPTRDDMGRALGVKHDHFVTYDLVPRLGTCAGAFNAPMLWNSNFFMSAETMKILRLLVDVWLPDFKFGPGRCAITLARTPRYWETVTANLSLLEAWGDDLTIRHLVMPNHLECCTYPVIDWIAAHMPDVPVNIMDQYHPDTFCDPRSSRYQPRYADLARRPKREEIHAAYRYAEKRGINFQAITHERRGSFPARLWP